MDAEADTVVLKEAEPLALSEGDWLPLTVCVTEPLEQGVGEEEAPAFDHEPRMTKHSVEIARLAPHLPLRNQKMILDMIREMLGDAAEKPS
jgi:hypothetical protein